MAIARNPVLPGCHPDPSICRVGEEFFVVTSSFELFPGLPVHRSTDLAHWVPVGHAIHREDQLDLSTVPSSGGLFAPTIRHDGNRFLVACTLVDDAGASPRTGSFVVTATDPAGPWSDPAWIDGAEGIDPSILVGRDGRAWWSGTRQADPPGWPEQTEVWVRELDLETLRLVGEERVVWNGAVTGAVWAEGPHLFDLDDGGVLLLASEGGTERHHAVSVARAGAPLGEYRGNPGNPVLTHRHLGMTADVRNVGHADLVDDGRGCWWATVLATRIVDGREALQARETWLVPVGWEDGWPVFAPGVGRLAESVEVPWADAATHASGDRRGSRTLDAVAGGVLHPELALVRTADGRARVEVHGDAVRLFPSSSSLSEHAPHALLGWRLESMHARLSATLSLSADLSDAAGDGLRGGLVLRLSEARWVALAMQPDAPGFDVRDAASVQLVRHLDGVEEVLGRASVPAGATGAELSLELDGFSCRARIGRAAVGEVDLTGLSPSEGRGFFGVVAGAFAVGDPDRSGPIEFHDLRLAHRTGPDPDAAPRI
ncbi:alpha-N-arabinofuranosidase [Agromyces terreus]|uniref:Alpha-N-arabinofuranosidase n=1 Tax=Agromyces terreus TaxID=424795 RepID=A0A9X2GV42_9MICO|nr:glycoside hydrolase family 43 protein [Agromyces terreus]MCP2369570.1 alpha-N-arabinofuranosidase [Agromyces terreus]